MNTDDTIHNYDTPAWHVLHVRPRCEKKLGEYCISRKIEHYLPLRAESKVYQRRKVEVQKPLFPGYVFACFSPRHRALVLKSQQIVRILEVNDQARLLEELDQVRMALTVNPALGACTAVKRKTRVRIISGPFQGLEGMVSTLRGQTRVVLNVDMIGQGVLVEADLDMLERM
ncbi:transcription termination/antitermination protein NusG [Verrucomicrobiota bacterium]